MTVGLNWYAKPNFHFMANCVRASTDPTSPERFATTGDEDVNIFQLRSQIDF
jgi:phosphate-selective porin